MIRLAIGFLALYLAIGSRAPELGPRLAAAAAGALAVALFFRLCRRLGAAAGPATLAAIVLGAATILLPYARLDVRHTVEAALYTGLLDALLDAGTLAAARAGAAAGALVLLDPIFALAAAGGAVFVRRRGLAPYLAACVPLAVAAIFVGAPLPPLGRFRETLLDGLWGLFLSTGKGLFVLSPPLLLGAFTLGRAPRPFLAALGWTALPVVVVTALDLQWSGGLRWGAPALAFVVPALLVPFALALRAGLPLAHRLAVGTLVAAGLVVQLAAAAVRPGDYLAIAHDAGVTWLGRSNLAGSPLPCLDCFEETHRVDWLPPFQPIVGQLWLARHLLAGDDYATADPDAPWRRHTGIDVKAGAAYARARLDLWFLR